MKQKSILSWLIVWLWTVPVWANDAADCQRLFEQGNAAYQNEDYLTAISHYEAALQLGYESGEIYFNLGNAYYRNGRLGLAILNYERAALYLPHDANVQFNLQLANLQIKDRVTSPPQFFLIQWGQRLVNFWPARVWAMLLTVAVLLTAGLFAVYWLIELRRGRRLLKGLIGAGLVIAGLLLIPLSLRQRLEQHPAQGIILSSGVSSLAAPQPGSTELFIVHEGTKVRLLAEDGDWYKIELLDGKQGWIRSGDLGRIVHSNP